MFTRLRRILLRPLRLALQLTLRPVLIPLSPPAVAHLKQPALPLAKPLAEPHPRQRAEPHPTQQAGQHLIPPATVRFSKRSLLGLIFMRRLICGSSNTTPMLVDIGTRHWCLISVQVLLGQVLIHQEMSHILEGTFLPLATLIIIIIISAEAKIYTGQHPAQQAGQHLIQRPLLRPLQRHILHPSQRRLQRPSQQRLQRLLQQM